MPKEFVVWESHNDEVKDELGFMVLAMSEKCRIQAGEHPDRPICGVQFHPEVDDTEYGEEILRNFVGVANSHTKRCRI